MGKGQNASPFTRYTTKGHGGEIAINKAVLSIIRERG